METNSSYRCFEVENSTYISKQIFKPGCQHSFQCHLVGYWNVGVYRDSFALFKKKILFMFFHRIKINSLLCSMTDWTLEWIILVPRQTLMNPCLTTGRLTFMVEIEMSQQQQNGLLWDLAHTFTSSLTLTFSSKHHRNLRATSQTDLLVGHY